MRRLIMWLLCAMVFSIPWEAAVVIPELGTLSRLLGYSAIFAGFIAISVDRRIRRPDSIHVMMALFLYWTLFTALWSLDAELTFSKVLIYFRLAGMAWLIWEFARNSKSRLLLMESFVLGGAVSVASVLIAFGKGPANPLVLEQRYTGQGMNENDLALIIVCTIFVAFFLLTSGEIRNRLARWLFGLYCPVAGIAVIMTGSRGGVIALFVGALYFSVSYLRRNGGAILAFSGIVIIILMFAYFLVPQEVIARYGGLGGQIMYGTWTHRTEIAKAGLDTFAQHPLGGVGSGVFGMIAHGFAPHNTFLAVLVETGVIGFTIYLVIVGRVIWLARRCEHLEKSLWLAILIAWAVGGFGVGWDYSKTTWFLFGIVASSGSMKYRDNLQRMRTW